MKFSDKRFGTDLSSDLVHKKFKNGGLEVYSLRLEVVYIMGVSVHFHLWWK